MLFFLELAAGVDIKNKATQGANCKFVYSLCLTLVWYAVQFWQEVQKMLKPHPYSAQLPMMSKEELDSLVADLKQNGQKEPILIFEGMILDGRNRYLACQKAGIEPNIEEFHGSTEDAQTLSISRNLVRRHLSASQKAMVLVNAGLLFDASGGRQYRKGEASVRSTAERFGVNHVSVYKALWVKQNDSSGELVAKVLDGELSVAAAELEIRKALDKDSKPKQKASNVGSLSKKLQSVQAELESTKDPKLKRVQTLIRNALDELEKIVKQG